MRTDNMTRYYKCKSEEDEEKYTKLIDKYVSIQKDIVYAFDKNTVLSMFSELSSECYDEGYRDGYNSALKKLEE